MRKIIIFTITLIMAISLVACTGMQTVNAPSQPTTESVEEVEETNAPHMIISIDDGDGGYYSLMSSGTVTHDEEYNYYEIFLDNPALLAFKVSEKHYPGGVGTMSGDEIGEMISSIETFLAENNVDENSKAFIEGILQQIKDIPVIEGAST